LLYRSNPVVIARVRCLIVFRVSRLNLHNDTVESRELNQSFPSFSLISLCGTFRSRVIVLSKFLNSSRFCFATGHPPHHAFYPQEHIVIHRCSWEDLAIITWPNLAAKHLEFFDLANNHAEPEPHDRVVGYGYPRDNAIEAERKHSRPGVLRISRALSAAPWISHVMAPPPSSRLLGGFDASRHYLVEWDPATMNCAPFGYSGSAVWRVPPQRNLVWRPVLVFLGIASHFYEKSKAVRVIRPVEVLRFIKSVFGA
jgi:hypothetical protein